jgi:BirA family biotin operon repressor/biotin-[acetyl-CoA-carboxylase] ligase
MSSASPTGAEPPAPASCDRLGHPRIHLRRTDSTNDRARELALQGAPHGTLVTAEEQTAGRGRHGRRWSAAPRSALLMSVLLRRPTCAQEPALLPLAAAVAVCDVVGPQALVKWPNDVVFRSRAADSPTPTGTGGAAIASHTDLAKLAGILIEGRPQERWLVLGIGVNVAVDLADLPPEVQGAAATLGKPSDEIEPTLAALLRTLQRRLAQPVAEILTAWRSRDALIGSQVAWQHGVGLAEGVSDRGRLLLRAQDGSTVELDSGEVTAAGAAR